MRSKLYVIHNTTDKVAWGEVSLHLNALLAHLSHLPLKRESGGGFEGCPSV